MHDVQSGVAHRLDRILIRLPNWLGDVLMARPLLHDLHAGFPDAEIRGIAPAGLVDLLQGDGVFGALDAWPDRGDSSAVTALRDALRRWQPRAAVVLPPSFSSAWFARSTGAPVRVGFAQEGRSWTLSSPVARASRGDLHLSSEYRQLGRRLAGGGLPEVCVPDLPVPEGGERAGRAALGADAESDRPWAVIGPGAIYGSAKRWSAERFADVGRRLVRRGLRVFVCGTDAERDTCATVAASIGKDAVSLAGRTSLPALAWLCSRASLAVCNDSGLSHLCAAHGTPTIAIFGSTSSAWTAPLGRHVRVVQNAPVCSPCFRRTCSIGYTCLESVTVDAVLRAAAELAA